MGMKPWMISGKDKSEMGRGGAGQWRRKSGEEGASGCACLSVRGRSMDDL